MRARWFAAGAGIVIALIGAGARLQAVQRASGDEEAIRKLIAAHAAASHQGDLRGLVDVYHAGADVRFSDGAMLRGRRGHSRSAHTPVRRIHEGARSMGCCGPALGRAPEAIDS